jgi:hypothetical protein
LLPASLVATTIAHVIVIAVAMALVAVARPSSLLLFFLLPLHHPLCRTPPSLPTPWPMPPLLSSLHATLNTVAIALVALALFFAALIIRCTLLSFFCCLPLWSCSHQHSLASHCLLLMLPLQVECCISPLPQMGGVWGCARKRPMLAITYVRGMFHG